MNALIEAFDRCIQQNQAILEHLKAERPLEALDDLFQAKAEALTALNRAMAELGGENPPAADMTLMLQVQASAAQLETQVAEALGEIRKRAENVTAVTKAYGALGAKSIDNSGPNQLDLKS